MAPDDVELLHLALVFAEAQARDFERRYFAAPTAANRVKLRQARDIATKAARRWRAAARKAS